MPRSERSFEPMTPPLHVCSDATITSFPLQPLQDSTGTMPMKVDRIKGKSGGKGKKGKDGKGKSKSKDQKGKGKNQNQAPWSSTSTTSWTSSSKGGGKGDQKGSNEKGKGKSKTKEVGVCYNCGRPGRMAKDCWRIRQVGSPDPSATVVSQATAQESLGPSASQVNAGLSVKRITSSSDGGQAASHETFDLRSTGASSWEHVKNEDQHVRMVKFFYIDEEEDSSKRYGSSRCCPEL